ncbi:MAG TPA: phospholipase D-like domain-containing protein [Methylomirabilota bacterium]|nr:phospholipase D-like domain-containing protein [Methylomirabilota bacterium]
MNLSTATRFRWLKTGDEAFTQMIDAIAAAVSSVRLETYIFEEGLVGRALRDALVSACRRGVKVRVLVDALGSRSLPNSFAQPLHEAGGQFQWFNPLNLFRLEYRDHRKILVCDEKVAFIGGFNVADHYLGDGITRGWKDLGLRIEGPLAAELARAFDDISRFAEFRHHPFLGLRRARGRGRVAAENWHLLQNGPGRGRNHLKRSLTEDLARARDVRIISAYFLPGWRLRRELRRAARRGATVELILAGRTDVRLSKLASQRLYASLLRAGVRIFEYQPQILHAKLYLIDHHVYVGSANLDARSMDINYELLVRVSDRELAGSGRRLFAETRQHCRAIDRKEWRRARSFWTRLMERWSYFVLARLDRSWAERRWRRTA